MKTKLVEQLTEGLTGPTRMDLQKRYDALKSGKTQRDVLNAVEREFNVRDIIVNSSGTIVSFKVNESVQEDNRSDLENAVWAKTPKDYRSIKNGERSIMHMNRLTDGTTVSTLKSLSDDELKHLLNPSKNSPW